MNALEEFVHDLANFGTQRRVRWDWVPGKYNRAVVNHGTPDQFQKE